LVKEMGLEMDCDEDKSESLVAIEFKEVGEDKNKEAIV
jgi:hypothetical protein